MTDNQGLPPIGLMPEHVWRAKRLEAIVDALARYRAAAHTIHEGKPLTWSIEAGEHAKWLNDRQRRMAVDRKNEALGNLRNSRRR